MRNLAHQGWHSLIRLNALPKFTCQLLLGICVDTAATYAVGRLWIAGNHIHIDVLFKVIAELIGKGPPRATLLGDVVLLGGRFVPNSLRRGLLFAFEIDAQLGKKFYRLQWRVPSVQLPVFLP